MTLTDFLLARIAGDEAVANAANGKAWTALRSRSLGDHIESAEMNVYVEHNFPARALAECAARRRIVEAADDRLGGPNWRDAIEYAMREMASIYAEHPDYDKRWRA